MIVTMFYILTSMVFIYMVPLDSVSSAETFAAQTGAVLFGEAGVVIFSGMAVIAALGSLAAIILTAPRVYMTMARDGLFFRSIASIHPRFGTLVGAIVVQALLASLLVAVGYFKSDHLLFRIL
jgi:APA family basic amino acid/polyamine antiporter